MARDARSRFASVEAMSRGLNAWIAGYVHSDDMPGGDEAQRPLRSAHVGLVRVPVELGGLVLRVTLEPALPSDRLRVRSPATSSWVPSTSRTTERTDAMAMRDAVLEALLIETRGTLSASPLAAPLPDDRQRELERRCRNVIEAKPHLELAAWLAESWTFSRGLEGLLEGLRLITELLDVRWDELFPLEENDERDRLCKGQLSSVDAQLSRALLAVSMWGGISLRGYLELRLFEGFGKEQLEGTRGCSRTNQWTSRR